MKTKVLGIGLAALVVSVIFLAAPASAHFGLPNDHVCSLTGDMNGNGVVGFYDVLYLLSVGRGYTDSRHKEIPCTFLLYDNPDVNQDGEFTTSDVWLLWSYVEWYPYTPNPYVIYPNTHRWTKYPMFPQYNIYHCNLVGNDCRVTMWGLKCHTGTPWSVLTGTFTA